MRIANRLSSITYLGVVINTYEANAGEGIPMHTHLFSHGTVCQTGSCKITIDENSFVIPSGMFYEMPANTAHEIEAMEDGTIIINIVPDQRIMVNA